MILAEVGNKRVTFDDLSKLLIDNEYSSYFLELVIENLTPFKIFLKECLDNNYEIERIEVFKKEHSNKLRLGMLFKNISVSELLNKYKYLQENDSFIFFMESYYYSKDIYNYDKNNTPYIKPTKETPLESI